MRIPNILLWVQENTLSEKFYKKLGFTVEQSDDDHSVVSLGGFRIMLESMRDEAEFAGDALGGDKGKGMYIYIAVDNTDAAYRELQAKGVVPATQPRDWPWGKREFIIKDPDGYKICFSGPIPA